MSLLHYECISEFKKQFYKKLLTHEHLIGGEIKLDKLSFPDNTTDESANFWGYILEKNGERYLLPSRDTTGKYTNIKDIFPLLAKDLQKVAYQGKAYWMIKKPIKAKFRPIKTMSFRTLVDTISNLNHTNPNHRRLMVLMGFTQMMDRANYRIATPPGCVDADTEYMTLNGWKKIAQYHPGEKVLQYDKKTGNASFILPSNYIKLPCKQMYNFQNKFTNQMFSDDHTLLLRKTNGDLVEENTKEFVERHNKLNYGVCNRNQLTTFSINRKGIDLTDNELRVMVAVMADGHYLKRVRNPNRVQLQFKKERKIVRLRYLLKKANIKFIEVTYKNTYTRFKFNAPLVDKAYKGFWESSREQLKIICNEVFNWDGNENNQFFTKNKRSADFIQYAITSCGFTANMNTYTRSECNKEFTVTRGTRNSFSMHNNQGNHKISLVDTLDGLKYSFTVPTGYLVLRRNNNIFITHNCGKDSVVDTIGSLFGSAATIENPTVAKLEFMTSIKWLAVNEVIDIPKVEWRNIEQFLLSTGAHKSEVTKRSRAISGVKETLDISEFSLSLMYNDISDYSDMTKYIDFVAKKAVLDRFPPFRLYGTFTEDFNTIKEINVKEYVKEHFDDYKSLIYAFTYFKENLLGEMSCYNIVALDKFPQRWTYNIHKLLRVIDIYCESQEEFNTYIQLINDSIKDYKSMLRYPVVYEQVINKGRNMFEIDKLLLNHDTFIDKIKFLNKQLLDNGNTIVHENKFW